MKSSTIHIETEHARSATTPGISARVLVCQHGSRHRYAIPRMLEKEGMLSALYTDSSANSWVGRFVGRFERLIPAASSLDRCDIQGVPSEKICSSDIPYAYEKLSRMLMRKQSAIQMFKRRHQLLSVRMKQWGLGDANIVYSMYHENLDFVRHAKEMGAKSVVDVFVNPFTDSIVKEEMNRFPDWGVAEKGVSDLVSQLWEETVSLADLLICPSDWVAEGVTTRSPSVAHKIRIVPYGCSMDYGGRINEPVPGRILFAGRDPLRKGLHYLAEASSILKRDATASIDVRIAGPMPPEVTQHELCKDLNFLGQLDRSQMIDEFLTADMLVLPALSEGFAGVVAEAIGAGCPVVVTQEAGSPVQHGREGLIVPSRDAESLATSLNQLISDRNLRENCSRECLKQIPFYSEDRWRKRLVETLHECLSMDDSIAP